MSVQRFITGGKEQLPAVQTGCRQPGAFNPLLFQPGKDLLTLCVQ